MINEIDTNSKINKYIIANKKFGQYLPINEILSDEKPFLDIDSESWFKIRSKNFNTIYTFESIIGIDMGLRTFLTGITNKNIIEIGTNIYDYVKKYLIRLKNISDNKNISNKNKEKIMKRINEKINDKVNIIHLKSINFLISNFNTIIIGDLSNNKNDPNININININNYETSSNEITKNSKNLNQYIANQMYLRMNFIDFIKKLKYKCCVNNINLIIVDEAYSSQLCTNCMTLNKKKAQKLINVQIVI